MDIAGMIQSAMDMTTNVMNMQATKKQNQANQNFAEQQIDTAWNRSVDMWNKENAYNTPLNQMKRFEEAGLNKNLIYGQGTPGNANNAPTAQPANWEGKAPQLQKVNFLAALNAYQDYKMKDIQMSNAAKIGKSIELENIRKAIDNAIKSNEKAYQPAIFRAKINAANIGAKYGEQKIKESERNIQLKHTQAGVLHTQTLVNAAELQNKIIMNEILQSDRDYKNFSRDFLKENGYSVESNPSLWRMIFDAGRKGKEILKKSEGLPNVELPYNTPPQ